MSDKPKLKKCPVCKSKRLGLDFNRYYCKNCGYENHDGLKFASLEYRRYIKRQPNDRR